MRVDFSECSVCVDEQTVRCVTNDVAVFLMESPHVEVQVADICMITTVQAREAA